MKPVYGPLWDVAVTGDVWTLTIGFGLEQYTIGSADMPWGIAVDAACEFMDRIDSTRMSSAELMALCVKNAWRQR